MSALDALPHGQEFRFIDALVSLDGGKRAVGSYRVRGDEAFLAGHFPGRPLMPGVILVEAIAQLGGVAAQSDPEVPPVAGLLLTGIRGAKILGEITGYGTATDVHHLTQPQPQGEAALAAMNAACADAGIGPEAVGYVNAHGTGTPANDVAEAHAKIGRAHV